MLVHHLKLPAQIAFILVAQFAAFTSYGQGENPLSASAKLTSSQIGDGGTGEIVIAMVLQEHYHGYLERFKLTVESPDDLKLDQFRVQPVVAFMDSVSKKLKDGIENKAEMRATIEVPKGFKAGDYKARFNLSYQACTTDHCLFPKHILLEVPLKVISGSADGSPPAQPSVTAAISAPTQSAEAASGFSEALGRGTFSALVFVFFVGLLTSLTPCIYPMIPITLAVLGARTKGQSKLKSFALSFTYVLGIALTYSVLGVTAAKTGALFGSALANVYIVSVIAGVFIAMGLSMYGVFEIQVPAIIRNRVGTAQTGPGYAGAFFTGLIAGVVASPCVGPVLVSVLTYIAQTQDMLLGFLFLFTFAMGLGILFMVLGTSSSLIGKIPKGGPWMEIVKFVFGTVMVAMALYYVKPLYASWLFHILMGLACVLISSAYGAFEASTHLGKTGQMRKGLMLATFAIGIAFGFSGVAEKFGISVGGLTGSQFQTAQSQQILKLNWQPFSEESVRQATRARKPVLLDFSAEWCGACKELERYTFTDARVRELSEKFTLLKVDATEERPELDILKKRYGVMGLPTMVFYGIDGKVRTDLVVTGFEDADAFLKKMSRALVNSN